MTIIAELLGVPASEMPRLVDWSHRMVAMYTPRRDRAIEDLAVAATQEFVAFLRGIVAERRREPRDDLITHLIAAEAAGDKLSEDELIAGVIQLLNAGHEATVHAIGNAVKAILESGESPAALFSSDEFNLGDGGGIAALRSAAAFLRPLRAGADVEFAGLRFRKGEKIGLLLGAANRDPSRWVAPHRFMPSRPLLPTRRLRGGHPFLHRRAAGAAGATSRAADSFPAAAEDPVGGNSALQEHVALSWLAGAFHRDLSARDPDG